MKHLIYALFFFVSSIWAEEIPGEKALIAAIKDGLRTGKVETILSLYDFTDVNPVYRDLEAFGWQEIIAAHREGGMLQNLAIVSIEDADEDMMEMIKVREFEGRFHVSNIAPAGFMLIDLGSEEEFYSYYFAVGLSKAGDLRLTSIKVTTEAPEGYESTNAKADPSDLKSAIQGFWVPNVDSFIAQQVKLQQKEDPAIDYDEFVEGMGPMMYAMLANVAMRIDGEVIETVNMKSGGPNSETVKYKITGTDQKTNSVTIQITRSGKSVDQTLTVEEDDLTIAEGDSVVKYFRVEKDVFEKRRNEIGL